MASFYRIKTTLIGKSHNEIDLSCYISENDVTLSSVYILKSMRSPSFWREQIPMKVIQ